MHEPVYAGLVGGGTRTECVLVDVRGDVLGRGMGGPSNTNFVQPNEAAEAVCSAVTQAFEQAKVEKCNVAAVASAGALADTRGRTSSVRLELAKRAERILPITEHRAALAACGIFRNEGVAVVAGTGSSAVAYRQGRSHSAGGWGSALGDEGSGYHIATKALSAATRSFDGAGPKSKPLECAVCEHFGVAELPELVTLFYSAGVPRSNVAALCETLVRVKEDPVVERLFMEAASDLAAMAAAAACGLYERHEEVLFAMSGGVWKAGAVVTDPFRELVRLRYGLARFVHEQVSPAHGAALLAAEEDRKR